MRHILFLFILISLFACKPEGTKEERALKEKIEKASDSELAAKLYQNYTVDPKTQAQLDENEIIDYLAARNLDFQRYSSGLYVQQKKKGSGPNYVKGQPTTADYRGFFLDGKIFDSSFSRGEPIIFKKGQMINGWNQAQGNMNPGSEATIIVPSYLGYAERGFPGAVPPNTVIAFDIYFKK